MGVSDEARIFSPGSVSPVSSETSTISSGRSVSYDTPLGLIETMPCSRSTALVSQLHQGLRDAATDDLLRPRRLCHALVQSVDLYWLPAR